MRRRELYLYRLVRYLWGFKVTPAGRVLVSTIVLTALGSVTTQLPIYLLFTALVGLLAVAETAGWLMKPSLAMEGSTPFRSTAGGEVTARFVVQNRSRWRPALDLMLTCIGLPRGIVHRNGHDYVPHLPAGGRTTLSLTLSTERRGVFPLPPVHAVSTFPCNLMRFGGARTPPGRLVVLPAYHSLEEFSVPLSHRYQPGGANITQGVGHSPEFVGNREYVAGEPARRIDSRAWARTGKPVVKEYHEEYVSRIALILDTHVPARGLRWTSTPSPKLEAAVSLMAAIAERLNLHEHVIDLFAAGPELYVFRTSGGATRFDSVPEILAGVDACRRNPFEQISPLVVEELESISTAVCIFIDWDETRREFVRRVLESGCMLKGVLLHGHDAGAGSAVTTEMDGDWTYLSASDVSAGRVVRI